MKKHHQHLLGLLFITCAFSICFHDYFSSPHSIQSSEQEEIKDDDDDEKFDNSDPALIVFEKKDTLKSVLKNTGLSQESVTKVLKTLKETLGEYSLQPGQEINLQINLEKDYVERLSFRLNGEYDVNLSFSDGKYNAEKKQIQLTKKLKYLSGSIDGSFHAAAKKGGLPAKLVKTAAANLGYIVNFQHEIKKGDSYQFLYESYTDPDGKEVKTGSVLYISLKTKDKDYCLYAYGDDPKKLQYYTKEGEGVVRGLLQTPLDGRRIRITSGFTLKGRNHPILGFCRAHKGVDFGATYGTPVLAAGDGVVTQLGYDGDYGNKIVISHRNGHKTVYAHLSKFKVKKGDTVKQRQVIGNVGSTGLSTGPHLHYEVLINNVHVNPMSVKRMPAEKLSGIAFKKFKNQVGLVDKTLSEYNSPTPISA